MVPFATLTDKHGHRYSVNPELVQFVREVENRDDECLVIFGKDQLLRVSGTISDVTKSLSDV